MEVVIPKERFEELLFEQKDAIHTQGSIHGYKLSTAMGTKTKRFLFLKINGKSIQITVGEKAFKQIKDATNNSYSLEE